MGHKIIKIPVKIKFTLVGGGTVSFTGTKAVKRRNSLKSIYKIRRRTL